MLKISEKVYEEGYQITGEGRRLDIIGPEGKKECEICFLDDNEILIMTSEEYRYYRFSEDKILIMTVEEYQYCRFLDDEILIIISEG